MTTDQPRTPAGNPSGGEFSSRQWPDGDVTLGDDLDEAAYNRTGTFLFPPRPRSAQQLIRFWTEVEIEDAVLETLSLGYERWADGWQRAQVSKWLDEVYLPSQKIDRYKYRAGQINEAQRQAIAAAVGDYRRSSLEPVHPERIPAMDARTVARAGQMWFYAGALSEEDQQLVDEHSVLVGDRPESVAQVVDRYNLRGIRDWFAGPTRAIVESLEQQRDDMAAIAEMGS